MRRLAWRMRDLRRSTSRVMKDRASGVRAGLIRSDLNKLFWVYRVRGSSGKMYTCRISIPPKHKGVVQKFSDKPEDYHVRVSCTCPAFQYWGPGFLSERQDYGRGAPITNGAGPRVNTHNQDKTSVLSNHLCKHLMAASAKWITRRFKEKKR